MALAAKAIVIGLVVGAILYLVWAVIYLATVAFPRLFSSMWDLHNVAGVTGNFFIDVFRLIIDQIILFGMVLITVAKVAFSLLTLNVDGARRAIMDLLDVLDRVIDRMGEFIEEYTGIETAGLTGIARGITGAARGIVGLQEGGIVTRPTLAVVGEAGPEAVIPLGGGFSPNVTINANIASDIDIEHLANRVASIWNDDLRRLNIR
jgi:hypothetical protein